MQNFIKFLLLFALLVPGQAYAQEVKVKDVNVSVQEDKGYKKITIKKTLEDGTIDIINWEGEGEIPSSIIDELGPGGGVFFIKEGEGEVIQLGDSAKVIKKTIEVIVDENGAEIDRKEDKEIKVIIHQEGENVMQLGEDTEVIIMKEGEEIDGKKKVKVWVEKAEDATEEGEQQIKIRINQNGEQHIIEQNGGKQEIVIIEMADGKQEKIIIDKDNPLPEAPKIERSLKLKDFQVSPNPASERINLQFKGKKMPVTVRLIDATGRELYKEFLRDFDGNYQNQIEIEGIPSDFLFISIEQKGKVYTDKVILKQ